MTFLMRSSIPVLTSCFKRFASASNKEFLPPDSGQTVRFGDYEAATDAILYEFDPEYRRQVSIDRQQSERTFGASLRRLRKQRGLRQEDFEPDVTAKTIARIEQGQIQRIQKGTLNSIARRLRVNVEEIETF